MRLPQPLHRGILIKRYKRFLADVRMDDTGETITAHCADPGRLPGLAVEDAVVWLSKSDNPKRKLSHRLELIEHCGSLVGLNTNNANHLAMEALQREMFPQWKTASIRREVRFASGTRLDFKLEWRDKPPLWLEVKNVTWRDTETGLAFPDAVTARGTKHLEVLRGIVMKGGKAALLFIAQRGDAGRLRIAGEIDPAYARAFDAAREAGVAVLAVDCAVSLAEIACRNLVGLEECRF